MRAPEVQHRSIRSFDGTTIAYQVSGEGPAVVLANGLGGTYTAWRHQYALFGQRYRLISWDYRGLFRSGRPPRPDTLDIPEQVRDLALILEEEGVTRAVFMGWSMGAQVLLEHYRHHAGQFAGLVILNGVAGRPFSTLFDTNLLHPLAPVLAGLMKHGGGGIRLLTRITAQWSGLLWTMRRIGLVAPSMDPDVLFDLAREYATLDFEAYGTTLRLLGLHDASDLLHRVDVPVLVITGGRDRFTPVTTARAMVEALPSARLVLIEHGTHYTAVEFPRQVNEHLRDFFRSLQFGDLL